MLKIIKKASQKREEAKKELQEFRWLELFDMGIIIEPSAITDELYAQVTGKGGRHV